MTIQITFERSLTNRNEKAKNELFDPTAIGEFELAPSEKTGLLKAKILPILSMRRMTIDALPSYDCPIDLESH